MNTIWKSGTKKAYYGYLGSLILGFLGSIVIAVSALSGAAQLVSTGQVSTPVFPIIVYIAVFAATAYYIMGLAEMKKAAESTALASGTSKLFNAAIISAVVAVLNVIFLFTPIIGSGIILAIADLVAFFIMWKGFSEIKENATNAFAQEGGAQLAKSSLLSLIAAVVALIPVIGSLAALVLLIIALIKAIKGWKALANSDLE